MIDIVAVLIFTIGPCAVLAWRDRRSKTPAEKWARIGTGGSVKWK